MKKLTSAVLTLLLLVVTAAPASANSAPSYWQAYPSSEMLAVDENSPVSVEREQLTFDFSARPEYDNDYSLTALVTAAYEMSNPTGDTLSVQMAFPLVASAADLSTQELAITCDGQSVPYEIFLEPETAQSPGDAAKQFSYGGVGHVIRQELSFPGFDLDDDAVLYRFSPASSSAQEQRLSVSFRADAEKTRIIASGFTQFSSSEDGMCTLGTSLSAGSALALLVLGDDLTFDCTLSDGAGNPADLSLCDISREPVSPREYLLEQLRETLRAEASGVLADAQLMNVCLTRLAAYSAETGFADLGDLVGALYADRIVTLVYSVEFPPKSARSVSVSYPASGIMDRRETVTPTYQYTYLLSPAKNWAGFGGLELRIIPPEEAPFLIDSSIPLEADAEGNYAVSLDHLPETELTFTLYAKPYVTFLDRAQKTLNGLGYALFFLWPVLAVIAATAALLTAVAVKRKKRRDTGDR